MRLLIRLCLALTFAGAMPTEASAQPVVLVNVFEVPQGKVGEALELMAKGRSVIQRHAPENTMTVYSTMTGPNTGGLTIFSEYPSAEAWAAARSKIYGDPDFQMANQEGAALGAELTNSILLADITPWGAQPARARSVSQLFVFRVPPGQTGPFLQLLMKIRDATMPHSPGAHVSVYSAMVGAPGTVGVAVEHPSAEAWGAAQPKIAGDSRTQELIQELWALGVEPVANLLRSNVTPW